MKFANPEFFYLFILLAVLLVVYIYSNYRRARNLKAFGELALVQKLMPDVSHVRPVIKFWLAFIALAMLIVVLARPQFGSKKESITRQGIETVIALDISNSMLAEDIAPNRLERSKQAINNLINKLNGDRIGVIIFAGNAYVQLPITTDYAAAKMFLSTIDTDLIPTQGTEVGAAINLAVKSFGITPNFESEILKLGLI